MSKHLLKSTAVVGGMTLGSRILGFVRDVVIARYFGADAGTDAFFVAFKVPNLFRRLFAEGAFAQAFVPVLADYRENQGLDATRAFLDRTAGTLALVLALAVGVGTLAAPVVILLFAPGFYQNPEQYGLSVEMLRIVFPYLFFICLAAFSGGILNTYGHFAVPAFTPVLLNLSMISAVLWWSPRLPQPIVALAFGVLLAGVLQLGFQLPALWRLGLLPRPRLGLDDAGVRRIARLMAPAVFGTSVGQLNLLLNTLIASFLVSGSVSWLYYSDRLVEFPLGIFGVAIGTVILPHLSKRHANLDPEAFSRALDWALRWMVLIGLPATLGLALLAKPLVYTLFQYERFSAHDAEMAALSLMGYAVGLLGFIGVKVLVPGFSARQDLATPARFGVYTVGVNLAAGLLLVWLAAPWGLGHAGLALATALAAWCNAGLLLARLARERVYRPEPGWPAFLLRVGWASALMAGLLIHAAGAYAWPDWTLKARALHLGLWIGLGFAAYLVCLAVLGLRPRHVLLAETA
ncbi:murein biosynthesis integral membrane protein MurJ [Methylomagnum ishizawai]|uniref:murein biosynthesis integral membrane protein MurJ n=1 Tax=Methylomagnum ishizawai TaxID=1760988 RepID=UPI001C80FD10|nr:murein biosynthesis integral membrane protein MurJ [Methylomagnum ishizawai]